MSVKALHDTLLSSDNDGSEDDWHEMEPIHDVVAREGTIEVDLTKPAPEGESEESKMIKLIRQEIARKRRERIENCHKVLIFLLI